MATPIADTPVLYNEDARLFTKATKLDNVKPITSTECERIKKITNFLLTHKNAAQFRNK